MNYNLSTDYHALYDAVSKGAIAVGFVPAEIGTLKDVVKITRRSGDGYIIGYRGCEVNGTYKNRRDFFVAICEESKLQYIPFPDNSSTP